MGQLMFAEMPLRDVMTGTSNLWDICAQFKDKIIKKPPHQRDLVWSQIQKGLWVERLRSNVPPVGSIVTYQLTEGSNRDVYLNDGFQRISTTLEYLYQPDVYGDIPEIAAAVVRKCAMPIQHRHYRTVTEALKDFQGLNLGTHLLPFDYCRGFLTYIPNYDQLEPILDKLHSIIPQSQGRVLMKSGRTNSQERTKNFLRHDYALFYRFISKRIDRPSYRVATGSVAAMLKQGNIIEMALADILTTMPLAEVEETLQMFEAHVKRETSTIENIWFAELGHSLSDTGINLTLFRWILECSIVRRHNQIGMRIWEEFVRGVLYESHGRSQVVHVQSHRAITFSLGNMTHLKSICEIMKSTFHDELCEKRKRPSGREYREGYDASHILPFAVFGDGPIIGEPASRNRSRGAKPIQEQLCHTHIEMLELRAAQ